MKQAILIWCISFLCVGLHAQEIEFSASVNTTTVEAGKVIRIDFTLKNVKGEFEAPDFAPFSIVGGPNRSTSMQMINGVVTQESTYSYYLQTFEAGIYIIPEARLFTEDGLLESQAIEIEVLAEGQSKESLERSQNTKLQKLLKTRKVKKF